MEPQVLVVASSQDDAGITVWDASTATFITSFKASNSLSNGMCTVGSDYLATAQGSKDCVHIYAWHKEQAVQRCFLAEKATCLAASPDGIHLAAGAASGAVSVWELGSGRLLNVWPAHFRAVTVLCFTDGGSMLLTGSEDTSVHTWTLSQLLDSAAAASRAAPQPWRSCSFHTLPVTDLAVGAGEANPLVASCSQDQTVQVWSLTSAQLLRSVSLPAPLRCLAMDALESTLWSGGDDGRVFEMALAGSGDEDGERLWRPIDAHAMAVTCLAVSGDGSSLACGCADGSVGVWDLLSHQPLLRFQQPCHGPVTCLLLLPRPPFLSHSGLRRSGSNASASASRPTSSAPSRQLPLAPLRKFPGVKGALQPWESTPVVLDGSTPFSHLVDACGLSHLTSPAPSSAAAPPALAPSGPDASALAAERDDALAAARSWKSLHSQLFEFCSSQLLRAELPPARSPGE